MKKFLAFLLIVAIACTAVEDMDFEGLLDKFFELLKKGWNWIQEQGILNIIAEYCPGWTAVFCSQIAKYHFEK